MIKGLVFAVALIVVSLAGTFWMLFYLSSNGNQLATGIMAGGGVFAAMATLLVINRLFDTRDANSAAKVANENNLLIESQLKQALGLTKVQNQHALTAQRMFHTRLGDPSEPEENQDWLLEGDYDIIDPFE